MADMTHDAAKEAVARILAKQVTMGRGTPVLQDYANAEDILAKLAEMGYRQPEGDVDRLRCWLMKYTGKRSVTWRTARAAADAFLYPPETGT